MSNKPRNSPRQNQRRSKWEKLEHTIETKEHEDRLHPMGHGHSRKQDHGAHTSR